MSDLALAGQLVLNGLATGFLYALLAIGFTLIWKSVAVANFAQGDFAVVGMFAALAVYDLAAGAVVVALLAAVAAATVAGVAVERLAIRPAPRADPMARVLATLGASMVISNSVRLAAGPTPLPFPAFLGLEPLALGPLAATPQSLGTIAIALALVGLLHALYARTTTGKALRATAENRDVARLMGIDTDRMATLAFASSAALGAVAGVLLAPFVFVATEISFPLLVKALLAAVVGGFGSYPGALLGGLLIGVLDNLGAFYVSSDYRDLVSFSVLIAVLLARPAGLLGRPAREL